jgi:hypothetical protein
VAIAADMERFLEILHARAPAKTDELTHQRRRVRHGLLSVGLKLHCLGTDDPLRALVDALGGDWIARNRNVYKHSQASYCLVLPPVGSAHAAVLLLEAIAQYTCCNVFNNANIQIQVCSPGRLSPHNAALHAIGFYLTSDTLRRYDLSDFTTTVSEDYYQRGKRLVIYDAGAYGDFDGRFEWWSRTADGLVIRPSLPFLNGRTDILVGPGSETDIHNINLLATLLVHAQSEDGDGYWSSCGDSLARDMFSLLDHHMLTGLVDAPWVCASEGEGHANDLQFYSALQELTSYATGEAARLGQGHAAEVAGGGILEEMHVLMKKYRALVIPSSEQNYGGA